VIDVVVIVSILLLMPIMFIWILLMPIMCIHKMILVNVGIMFYRVDINGGVILILSSLILSLFTFIRLDTLRCTLDDVVIW